MLLCLSNTPDEGVDLGAKGGGSLIEGDTDEAVLQVLISLGRATLSATQ
jgi:hypothetical protein